MRSILNLLSFVIIVLLIVSIAGLVKNVKEKKPIKKNLEALGACLIVFVILGVVMLSRNPESVENGLETKTTKNEIKQSIAVETETMAETTKAQETVLDKNIESEAQMSESATEVVMGVRDETLNGHGYSDSGREEPQYVGIIGYAVNRLQGSADNYEAFTETPWKVPVYEKDKQFYNEVGTIDHKTEVLVLSQTLKHEGYGRYSGYLTVEDTESKEQYILDVADFITKPYWAYDLREAALIGHCVAEFHQKSDYYPVNKNAEKVELEDGTIVHVVGRTGSWKNGPDGNENQIEAIVFKDWAYGYGGVEVYFNVDDLELIY